MSLAFLLKSGTSVKSSLLETPRMNENSKERGTRGRNEKPERSCDGKKLDKREDERNLPQITSVKTSLLIFLQPHLPHPRWEVVLSQRGWKFLVLWLVADAYVRTAAKYNNHKAAVGELWKRFCTILIFLIPWYFDNFGILLRKPFLNC